MKKLFYSMAGILLVASLVSCEKQKIADLGADPTGAMKGAQMVITENMESTPISAELSVTPYLIPGENRGGNRTCAEVEAAFGLNEGTFLCGNKVDWDGDGFVSDFPAGLTVWVDGIHVGFEMLPCIEIDGSYYKVGAVIVKGSNAANVYYYGPEGASYDYGLAAPGDKHMVSNLTFCFVPCEGDFIGVLAVKTFLQNESHDANYAFSGGTPIPNDDLGIGYNLVLSSGVNVFDLVLHGSYNQPPIGTITAEVVNGKLEIVVDAFDDNVLFGQAYFYFGPVADIPYRYNDYPFTRGNPWTDWTENITYSISLP